MHPKKIPVTDWPSAAQPAQCIGAREVYGAVAQGWDTPQGRLWLMHRLSGYDPAWDEWSKELQDETAFVCIKPHVGIDGPELGVRDGSTRDEDNELSWPRLSQILGQPVPYWAGKLRGIEAIDQWRPGAKPQILAAVPDANLTPVLRLAMTLDSGDISREVLFNFAQSVHDRATAAARQDIEIVKQAANADTITYAAIPLAVPNTDFDDLEPSTRRAGWLSILGRTDDLACAAIRELVAWNSGADFPYSTLADIHCDDPMYAAWVKRLQPTERTAAFELFGDRRYRETLIDPATDAPVLVDQNGRYLAAIPQYIPSAGALTEVILGEHGMVWIRTTDTFYLAPEAPGNGIRWGYRGGSPKAFALLINQLLNGTSTQAIKKYDKGNTGLTSLAYHDWPVGTTFNRQQLEAAQRGEFHPNKKY